MALAGQRTSTRRAPATPLAYDGQLRRNHLGLERRRELLGLVEPQPEVGQARLLATLNARDLGIAIADREHQIPTHGPQDHLGRELPALELLALRHDTRAAIHLSRRHVYPIRTRLTNLQQIRMICFMKTSHMKIIGHKRRHSFLGMHKSNHLTYLKL